MHVEVCDHNSRYYPLSFLFNRNISETAFSLRLQVETAWLSLTGPACSEMFGSADMKTERETKDKNMDNVQNSDSYGSCTL
jgi:hypothetical protein